MIPLLAKELGVGARLKRTYALRAFYGAVLALVLWSRLQRYGYSFSHLTTSQLAQLGDDLFSAFVLVQFIGVTVFSLLAGADFVVKEVRSDTLGLLALTPLSGRDIVTAKWMAAVAQSCYLVLCGLPVLGACIYLGAVGFEELVVVTFSTLSSSVLAAALSVWTASHGRNPYGAGGLAGLAWLGTFILCATLDSIIPGIMGLLHPLGYMIRGSMQTSPSHGPNLGFVTIIPVNVGLAWLILGRAAVKILSPATLAPRGVRTSKDIVERQAYIEQAARNLGTRVRDFEVWDRLPLLWKDLRTRAAAQLSYEIRLGIGVFLVLLFIGSLIGESGAQYAFFHLMFPLSLICAVCAGSGLFFRDRDSGRMDTLRILPVGPWEIVLSKLASGPASPEGTVMLILQLLSLQVFVQRDGMETARQVATAAFLFLIVAYLTGALASLLLHKTRLAILASGSAMLGLLLWANRRPVSPYFYFDRLESGLDLYATLYLWAGAMLILTLVFAYRRKLAG